MNNPLLRSLRRGDPLIWLTGSALGVCPLMIAGLIGTPVLLREGETVRARGPEAIGPLLPALLGKAERDRAAIARIEKGEIGEINYRIEQFRLLDRKLDFEARRDPALDQGRERDRIRRAVEEQKALYATKQEELGRIVELAAPATLTVQIAGG